jgi:hypothetical protein
VAQDTNINAELEQLARKIEAKAGVTTPAQARDTEIVSKLRRIRDNIDAYAAAIEDHGLNDHTDVTVTSPSDRDLLVYSASLSQWVNDVIGLNDLSDVTLGTPSSAEFLRYNGTVWANAAITLSDLPAIALPDLSDTTISSPAAYEFLVRNIGNTAWINEVPQMSPSWFDNIAWVAGTADSLVTTDGSIVENTIGWGASDVIQRNGTVPLTANWDAGNFQIDARGFHAENTTDDSAYDVFQSVMNVEDTSSGGARLYRGLFIDLDYDYNNGAGTDTNTPRGLDIDMDIGSTAVGTSSGTPQLIRATITNDANTAFSNATDLDVPVSINVDNSRTGQSFSRGAFNFSLYAGANTSSPCIGTRSFVRQSGSATTIAYQGNVQAGVGATARVRGVEAFIECRNTLTRIYGFSSQPQAFGTPPANTVICAYWGDRGHWLASRGSLFITSTLRTTPGATATTHLTPANLEGAGYFEGQLEVDGVLYPDGGVTMAAQTMLLIGVYSDASRPAAGTAGRMIFNTTDGNLNIDDGTNWILPDGTTT